MKDFIRTLLIAVSKSSGRPLEHLAVVYSEETDTLDVVDVVVRDTVIKID